MRHLSFLFAVLLVGTVSCAHWDDVDKRSLEPVTGNPCGNRSVQCAPINGVTMCCWENYTCCSGAICPAGQCENMGGDTGLVGGARFAPQWKAGERPIKPDER